MSAGWAGVIVAVVSAVIVMWQLFQAAHQRRVEVGLLYVQRYWQIDDDLLQTNKGTPESNDQDLWMALGEG